MALLGATGTLGRLLAPLLTDAGWTVRPGSRSTGVDAVAGTGLDRLFDGADVVVDSLGIDATARGKATRFFTTAAGRVADAARRQRVGRIVCVSIANVDRPVVRRTMGYYDAKAAQEGVYLDRAAQPGGVPVTIARSAQWYELADLLIGRSLGPIVPVPTMLVRPIAAADAAAFVAGLVERDAAGPGNHLDTVAGPATIDATRLIGDVLAARHLRRVVLPLPMPRALRDGALVPIRASRGHETFEHWLARQA